MERGTNYNSSSQNSRAYFSQSSATSPSSQSDTRYTNVCDISEYEFRKRRFSIIIEVCSIAYSTRDRGRIIATDYSPPNHKNAQNKDDLQFYCAFFKQHAARFYELNVKRGDYLSLTSVIFNYHDNKVNVVVPDRYNDCQIEILKETDPLVQELLVRKREIASAISSKPPTYTILRDISEETLLQGTSANIIVEIKKMDHDHGGIVLTISDYSLPNHKDNIPVFYFTCMVFEPHCTTIEELNLKIGNYISITNVNIKYSRNGVFVDSVLGKENGNAQINRLEESDPLLEGLLDRKRETSGKKTAVDLQYTCVGDISERAIDRGGFKANIVVEIKEIQPKKSGIRLKLCDYSLPKHRVAGPEYTFICMFFSPHSEAFQSLCAKEGTYLSITNVKFKYNTDLVVSSLTNDSAIRIIRIEENDPLAEALLARKREITIASATPADPTFTIISSISKEILERGMCINIIVEIKKVECQDGDVRLTVSDYSLPNHNGNLTFVVSEHHSTRLKNQRVKVGDYISITNAYTKYSSGLVFLKSNVEGYDEAFQINRLEETDPLLEELLARKRKTVRPLSTTKYTRVRDISERDIESKMKANIVVEIKKIDHYPKGVRLVLSDYSLPNHRGLTRDEYTFTCMLFSPHSETLENLLVKIGNYLSITNVKFKYSRYKYVDSLINETSTTQINRLEEGDPLLKELLARKREIAPDDYNSTVTANVKYTTVCDIPQEALETNTEYANIIVEVTNVERKYNGTLLTLSDHSPPNHKIDSNNIQQRTKYNFTCMAFTSHSRELDRLKVQVGDYLSILNVNIKYNGKFVDSRLESKINTIEIKILEESDPLLEGLLKRKSDREETKRKRVEGESDSENEYKIQSVGGPGYKRPMINYIEEISEYRSYHDDDGSDWLKNYEGIEYGEFYIDESEYEALR